MIIGGTTGLGSFGGRLARAGANLVIVGRSRETATAAGAESGNQCRVLIADATDPATAPEAIKTALHEFGSFDGLYHVAGGSGRARGDGPLHEISDEGWEFTQKLNLTSLFYSNRAAVRQLLSQKTGGSVLNMGSVLGWSPSAKYFSTHAYATAKAAIIGMTKAAAAHYAPNNIRFNVIAPAGWWKRRWRSGRQMTRRFANLFKVNSLWTAAGSDNLAISMQPWSSFSPINRNL